MIDFTKKIKSTPHEKEINPIKIYDTLDRKSETGPLRPVQENILLEWFESHKDDKDTIIKLHTGEGKTLIGLLMLMSYLNTADGPVIYVCPSIYLVRQVCDEAEKFGIPYCNIKKNDYGLPNEFLLSKKILITHVQKIFNGKSKFGIGKNYTKIGAIVLDDSHACIDWIKSSYTIQIKRGTDLYTKLIALFEEELKLQGEGSFIDLAESEHNNTIMPIPYWNWIDKASQVIQLLGDYKDEKFIKFSWDLVKDNIKGCQAYVSNRMIEISPYYVPIAQYGTFDQADNRILMSATTQEDSFFIKGLGFSIDAVKNPLIDSSKKWSGEKMLLMPSLICAETHRDDVLNYIIDSTHSKFGIVSLVPSFRKTDKYKDHNTIVVNPEKNDIYEIIRSLKSGQFDKTIVLANRYDGIDLPDETCRILIMDSLPNATSLYDQYEELCRINSEIIKIRTTQKIEQGLGRSVRGEKDYCVIVITGSDLVKFIKSVATNSYFSEQTSMQVQIGIEIAEMAKEEQVEDIQLIRSLIRQCIQRDEGWKAYYHLKMEEIAPKNNDREPLYKILLKEKEAEDLYLRGQYEMAADKIQGIIDVTDDASEKGWYIQLMSSYIYRRSKSRSNELQIAAFKKNIQLLKPQNGIEYTKINYVMDDSRLKRIKENLIKHKNHEELMLHINSILSNLSFGMRAELFERAMNEIGVLIGFVSQRPDKEFRKGPDNLWCIGKNKYIMFECKNEVSQERKAIKKSEAGQMEEHYGWFEEEYGDSEIKGIMITPATKLSQNAYFSHKVEVMGKKNLSDFKSALLEFLNEFVKFSFDQLTEETINKFLLTHKLDVDSLLEKYSIEPKPY